MMVEFRLRKSTLVIEEIHHEGGPAPETPRRRGAILAVVANPFAGRYEPHLQPAMDALKPLGAMMTETLIAGLGGAGVIDAYGKAAIVGEDGEIEHGALWHVPGGYAMRAALGEGGKDSKAIVPSAMKVGAFGSRIDVPLGHINAAYVRSHFDAFEVGIADGPRRDEIVFILAMASGPRVHDRMGGLTTADVKGVDGLR